MILFQDGVITGLAEPAKNRRKYWIKQTVDFLDRSKLKNLNTSTDGVGGASDIRISYSENIYLSKGIYMVDFAGLDEYFVFQHYANSVGQSGWRTKYFEMAEEGYITITFRKGDNSNITPDDLTKFRIVPTSNTIFELNLDGEYEPICKDNWILLKKDISLPKWTSNAISIDFSKYKYLRFIFHESTNASCKAFELPVVNMNLTRTEQNFYVWLNKEHTTIDVRINAENESYSLCDIYGLA